MSIAMASVHIPCPSLGFACPYNGSKTRNIARLRTHVYSKQPKIIAEATNVPIVRRSANYPPSTWSYDYLQSLTNNYVGKKYEITWHRLEEKVRTVISEDTVVENPLATLELFDDLQRLGKSYHFKDEINNVLKMIYICYYEAHDKWNRMDLSLNVLGFRLLRLLAEWIIRILRIMRPKCYWF